MTIAAIVLAAGRGTRFGRDTGVPSKLLATMNGVALVRRVVDAAVTAGAAPVYVVTGHAEVEVRASLDGTAVRFVPNPDFALGLSSSLRAGLAAAGDADAALIMLADMPNVRAETLRGLIAAFAEHPDVEAVVPVYRGRWGNPVLLARRLFSAAGALTGDAGARKLLQADGRRLHLHEVDDAGVVQDIDEPGDLAAALKPRVDP